MSTAAVRSCSGVCNSCRKLVTLVVHEAASLAIPAVTTALGSFIGASTQRNRWKGALVGSAIGAAVGAAANALTPVAQNWVCGDCGCGDVSLS